MVESQLFRQVLTVLLLASALIAGGRSHAQERFFVETVQVHVVNVDVIVTDRRGRPATGLTREDFELLEDGAPVAITNFYAGSGRARAEEEEMVPAGVPEDQRLHLVIVLDLAASRPFDRNAAITHLQNLVQEVLDPSARVMVATLDRSLKMRSRMTGDRDEVTTALERIRGEAGEGVATDAQRRMLLRAMEHTQFAGDSRQAISRDREFYEEDARSQLQSIHGMAEWERTQALGTLGALERLSQSLAGIPGRKVMLYVGDGLSARPGEALFQAWQNKFFDLARDWGISAALEASRYELERPLRDMVDRANTSRVSFYTLEPGGGQPTTALGAERGGGVWAPELEAMETMSRQQSLMALTSGTGGRSLAGGVDGPSGLSAFEDELEGFYSLGFSPEGDGPNRYRSLRVRVKDDSLRVRHREGYRRRSTEEQMQDRTVAALVHGAVDNTLGVAIAPQSPTRRSDGNYSVRVMVQVPLGNVVFLPGSAAHTGRLIIYLAVEDDRGRTSPVERREFPISIPNDHILTALGQFAGFTFDMNLRRGPHRVAVTVQDELGGVVATTTRPLLVGDSER